MPLVSITKIIIFENLSDPPHFLKDTSQRPHPYLSPHKCGSSTNIAAQGICLLFYPRKENRATWLHRREAGREVMEECTGPHGTCLTGKHRPHGAYTSSGHRISTFPSTWTARPLHLRVYNLTHRHCLTLLPVLSKERLSKRACLSSPLHGARCCRRGREMSHWKTSLPGTIPTLPRNYSFLWKGLQNRALDLLTAGGGGVRA